MTQTHNLRRLEFAMGNTHEFGQDFCGITKNQVKAEPQLSLLISSLHSPSICMQVVTVIMGKGWDGQRLGKVIELGSS